MKKTLLTTLITCFTILSYAQPELDWVFGSGGSLDDFSTSVATDSEGNIYIAGHFSGVVDFDPSVASFVLTATEEYTDGFFAKYDASGNFVYVKHLKGGDFVEVYDLAIDDEDNVYITGYFVGDIDFNPSESAEAYLYTYDANIFIAKYDSDGNYAFAKMPLVESGGIVAHTIAVDDEGNIFIGGFFGDGSNFQTQAGQEAILSAGNGLGNAYIAKYDTYGNYIFAKNIARSEDLSEVTSMVIDQFGDVLVAGSFIGTADFNPNPFFNHNLTSAGYRDAFIAKYSGTGGISDFQYAHRIGSADGWDEQATDVAVDAEGNGYVIGYFSGTIIDEDGSEGAISSGMTDVFFYKYDVEGNYVMSRILGAEGNDYGSCILVDDAGMIYVGGTFEGSVDFNPLTFPTQVDMYTSVGTSDIFFAKYNSAGFYIGGHQAGGQESASVRRFASDNNGNIYLTGSYRGDAEFGTDGSELLSGHADSRDIFLAKYAFEFATNSIAENLMSEVILYPNPTSRDLTLMFNGAHDYYQANVLDISGKVICTYRLTAGQLNKRINVANIPCGIYAIQLIGSTGQDNFKFIKE